MDIQIIIGSKCYIYIHDFLGTLSYFGKINKFVARKLRFSWRKRMLAQGARCIRISCSGTHYYLVNNQRLSSIYLLGNYSGQGRYLGGFWDLVHREKSQLLSLQEQHKRLSSYINQKKYEERISSREFIIKKISKNHLQSTRIIYEDIHKSLLFYYSSRYYITL